MPDARVRQSSDDSDAENHSTPVADPERLHRRAVLLREIAEARARVARAAPWRSGTARLRIGRRRRGLR